MGRKRNTFSKAVKHLKSSKIEEKLQTLNEIPTMNTSGLYDLVPGALSRTEVDKDNPTIPDYTGIDWDVDGGDGRDTSGLFDAEGNSLFVTPPGDNSYILGPMASMFYNYSYHDWTMIGYIRESDRRFVNLGYLYENKTAGREFSGKLEDWTGNPEGNPEEWTEDWPNAGNFYSYGQLTLEQALWFRDTAKKGGTGSSGHESSDFRAFYPGPPSSTPDAFGRYYCTIVGTPKATTPNTKTVAPIDMCSSDNFSAIADLMKQMYPNVKAIYKGGKMVYSNYPEIEIDPEEVSKTLGNELKNPNRETANLLDKLGKSGETFLRYLTNTLPQTIDNKYLGDKYVNSMIKKAEYRSDGTLGFGDNILGTTGKPTRQGNNIIVPFNYDFNNNAKEFEQNKDNLNMLQKTVGRVVHNYLGKYSMDASPKLFGNIPIVGGAADLVLGGLFSKAIETGKTFGGAKHKSGELKIDVKQLEKDNPNLYNRLFVDGLITVDDMDLKRNSKVKKESYLLEDRKIRIMKSIKDPVVLPESKKKHKVKPGQRYKGKTNFQGMDKLMGDVKPQDPFKKERNAWSKDWQGYNARLSQEKKNAVLELVGDGKQAFNYMLNDSRIKNAEEMEKFWGLHPELYSYVFNGKKYKATRKEQVKGDYLVFLTDENGEKTNMLQSDISIKLAEEHEKEMFAEYNKTNEPTPFLKDPLMKKVAKRLKNEIDYPNKPAKNGYPNQPPPKQVDGWHPEYGKKYKYDKLDPVSAVMMKRAPTGDPEIDANVKKASMKPKVEKKRSNWREDIEV